MHIAIGWISADIEMGTMRKNNQQFSIKKIGERLLWAICFVPIVTAAQLPNFNNTDPTQARDSVKLDSEFLPDTGSVSFFYLPDFHNVTQFSDTLLGDFFEGGHPLQQRAWEWANLGNVGSPAYPLLHQSPIRKGFELGMSQYDNYITTLEKFRFGKVSRSFSDIYYLQGSKQNDAFFKATLSRNFTHRINFTMDYARISHFGQYQNYRNKHTSIGVGFWYHSKDDRYHLFLNYINNTLNGKDNGGISTDTLYDDNFYNQRLNVPVNLEDAVLRATHSTVAMTHFWQLSKKVKIDTIQQIVSSPLALIFQSQYVQQRYKFYDDAPTDDSLFYRNQLVDERGLRLHFKQNIIHNTLTFQYAPERAKLLFAASATHSHRWFDEDTYLSNENNLFRLEAKANFQAKTFYIQTLGRYILGNGNIHLQGIMGSKLGKWGEWNVAARFLHYRPTEIERTAYLSEQLLWSNAFAHTTENQLEGSYGLPAWQLSVTMRYSLMHNFIYFDQAVTPQQISKPISILQWQIKKHFTLGAIHLDNYVAIQNISENVIRLPILYSKNSLYFEKNLFKKALLLRTGVDFRINSDFYGNAYAPQVGQFYLQDSVLLKAFPAIDVFLSFRVKKFRAFVKMENITTWFNGNKMYYTVPYYPMFDRYLRFGVAWSFWD
ncbi:MAG: hypothetical protein KA974_06885 [Saprospiraceae bacterium]|nr:hypothetical protein [Saprospiraceae bacterium]